MKRFLALLVLLVLVVAALVAPVAAHAAEIGPIPVASQKAIADFILPLAYLIPLIVAVVNACKASRKLDDGSVILLSMGVGVIATGVAVFFPTFPIWAKVLVAGPTLGLSASGVFDLFKLFGTITPVKEA